MNKKHVPDLELCQEFDTLCKEKGIVVPETECYWVTENPLSDDWRPQTEDMACEYGNHMHFPAPLVSEQGEWLPLGYSSMKSGSMFKKARYICGRYEEEGRDSLGRTEANARQKMINYLLAEGIITKL